MVLRVGPSEHVVRRAMRAQGAQTQASVLARLAAQRHLAGASTRLSTSQAAHPPAKVRGEGEGEATAHGERASAWLGQARAASGMGPSAAQLRRLAEEVELPQVLLPPPSTAVDVARLERVLDRINFARTQLSAADAAATTAKPAASSAKQAAPRAPAVDPLRGELGDADLLQHLVGGAFTPADLPSLRRRLRLSPRVERAFAALLGRSAEPQATGVTDPAQVEPAPSPVAEASTNPPVPGPPSATAGSGPSQPAGQTAASPGTLPGRLADALRFTLRRQPRAAAPAKAPCKAPTNDAPPTPGALPATMSWSAFASLLTQRQLRALLDLAVLRLRDVGLQNASELWARLAEHERNQQEIASERFTQVVDFINTSAFARACWASGKASPLRNARPYGRGQGAIEPLDGREASSVRAELRRTEAALGRRRGLAAVYGTLGDASQLLDWLPAEGDRPAHKLRRVALTAAEIDGLGQIERAQYAATAKRLRQLERHDASSAFGRLVLSSVQLEQAAARCQRAAANATGHAAANLVALAERYRARSEEHAEQAKRSGYFEAIAAVGRRQRLELAQSMVAEAKQRESASLRHRALQADAADLQLPAKERAEARTQAEEVAVEVEDRRLRLVGMHAAVTLADGARPPGRGPLPEMLRTAWRGQSPLDADRAPNVAHETAYGPLRDAIVAPGTDLLSQADAANYLDAGSEAAATWAGGYKDTGFSRLQTFNRIASAAPRSIAPTAQVVSRQAQQALEDMASYFEGDRNDFYGALGREQGATQALVERLRGLQRVGG